MLNYPFNDDTQYFIMMKGAPASGKSTKALELVRETYIENFPLVRVSTDDIRMMLYGRQYIERFESIVWHIYHRTIERLLESNYSVIADATQLGINDETTLREIFKRFSDNSAKRRFLVYDLTDVPLETLLERNATRERQVDEEVIMKFWNMIQRQKDG